MPYEVVKDADACSPGKPWACKKSTTGEVMGCHTSKQDALDQMAALYANEPDASSGARAAAGRPAVRTVANVEVLSVGTWEASTGKFTATMDDLAAAVAAYDDSGYTTPVVKIGHVDPRFDGNPALGRLINPRLSDDKQTLIVDLAGVPTWLADLIDGQRNGGDGANAFPNRSIEGTFNLRTQTGTKHRFALTGLALLGGEMPAISTLADIASLYGLNPDDVAASAVASLKEEPMPRDVQAAVSLDQVRQSYYTSLLPQKLGAYSWVREVYTDKLIIDDDQGSLFEIPWKAKGNEVTFGEPSKVSVEYVAAAAAAPDPARVGALRSRLAYMPHPGDHPEDDLEGGWGVELVAIGSHSTGTDTAAWSAGTQEKRLSNDAGAATYRKEYAWVDSSGDPDTKAAYKFPHHFVSADGSVGAASTTACSAGIGALNGGRGGASIPDADRQGVYAHLARHLKDADLTPPELATAAAAPSTAPCPTCKRPVRVGADGTLVAHGWSTKEDGTRSDPCSGSGKTVTAETPAASVPSGSRKEGSAAMPFEMNDEQAKTLRDVLGLPEDADSEALLTALQAVQSSDRKEPVAATAGHFPPGSVPVDTAQLEELRTSAKLGEKAYARLLEDDRDRTIQAAIGDGRIPKSRENHWRQSWAQDPEGVKNTLEAMPKNLIPVSPLGYSDNDDSAPGEFDFMFPPTAQGV